MPATYNEGKGEELKREEHEYKMVITELATTLQENITGPQSWRRSVKKSLAQALYLGSVLFLESEGKGGSLFSLLLPAL